MRAARRLRRLHGHTAPSCAAAAPTPSDSDDGTAWSGIGDPADPFPTQDEAGFPATDEIEVAVAQLVNSTIHPNLPDFTPN